MISRNTNATKYLQLSHLFFMVGFLLPRTRFGDYEPPRSLQIFEPMFLHKSSRRIRWNNGAVTLFRLSWFYGTNSTSTILQKLVKYQNVNSTYLYRRKYHYHFWTSISVDCTTGTFHNGGTRRSTYSLHPMHVEILLFTKQTNWIKKKHICVRLDISTTTAQKHELITFPSSIGAGVSIMNGRSKELLWNATRGRYTFS